MFASPAEFGALSVTTKIVFSYRNLRLPCDVCVSSAVQFAVLGQSKKPIVAKMVGGPNKKIWHLKSYTRLVQHT